MNKRNEQAESTLRSLIKNDLVPKNLKIICFDLTGSTNRDAKDSASLLEGDALFVAKKQDTGRGRLGRSFSSGEGGLYMSLLFKRKMIPEDAVKITVYTAVCVRRAIKRLTGFDTSIKWVNDIFVGEKKLAGILCEGACDEFGQITHAVVGIGLNVLPVCDPSLSDIATSLSEHITELPTPLEIAAAITEEMYAESGESFESVISEYKNASCIIGRRVKVINPTEEYYAIAIDIDEDGALIVEMQDGAKKKLTSGDVSVRF